MHAHKKNKRSMNITIEDPEQLPTMNKVLSFGLPQTNRESRAKERGMVMDSLEISAYE